MLCSNAFRRSSGIFLLPFIFVSTVLAAGNVSVTATIGTGGPYSTLDSAFIEINNGIFKGIIGISINGSTTETLPPTLNASGVGSASYTSVIIKPAVTCTITGSFAGEAVIKLNGASNVTIDGSKTNGGVTQDLTITNTNTSTTSAVVQIACGTTGAKNVTIKNCIITGNAPATTFTGILSGGNNGIGVYDPATAANNNTTIQNNAISNVQWGVDEYGLNTGADTGTVITGNQMSSLGQLGVYISYQSNMQVNNNTITGVTYHAAHGTMAAINAASTITGSSTSISGNQISQVLSTGTQSAAVGILISASWPAGGAINGNTISNIVADSANASGIEIFPNVAAIYGGTISGNNINTISSISSSNLTYVTAGASGIFLSVGSSYTQRTKLTVSNNFIADITGLGDATAGAGNLKYNGSGIEIYSGGGYNIYFNSINLAANQTHAGQSAALYIDSNSGGPVPDSLTIEDNLLVNSETTGSTYGIYSEVTKIAFTTIDYNDYYATTALGYIEGTGNATTPATMETVFGGNTHSGNILPDFTSATNLHLADYNNFCLASGAAIAGITTDIDGDTRVAPDMGADEFTFYFAGVTASATCPGSNVTVTVTDTTGTLATGTYFITYNLSSPNLSVGDTATITYVSGISGNGTFTIPAALLANGSPTTVTITSISSTTGCGANLTPVPVKVAASTNNQATIATGGGTTVPSVSISTPQNTICAATPITFTAVPTNGGTAPTYQWKRNGTDVGTNADSYTDNSPSNNDVITCFMTSNSPCASPDTTTSNSITVTINSNVVPAISIAGSADTFCSGTNVTFTASPTNGGAGPAYQWKVNGSNVGSNSNTYSSITLANHAVITCILTSNAQCANPTTATSNADTVTVNATVTPAISISGGDTICSGGFDAFIANITSGGSSPSYQWRVNGSAVGTNSNTFSSSSLGNGDVITCVLISNATCANPVADTSNAVSITVSGSVTPTALITASDTIACAGQTITFMASVTGQGSTPVYQWQVNGTNAGPDSATFTTNTLSGSDVVTINLTSSLGCASPQSVTSGAVHVTVNALPTVTINPVGDTVCNTHGAVTLSGTPAGGVFSGAGVNGGVFYPDSASTGAETIIYIYTDTNNCSNAAADTVIVEICTSIDKITLQNISVYPNPAGDIININSGSTTTVYAEITDINGKILIENMAFNANIKTLNLSAFSAGVYLLRVRDEAGAMQVIKVVKQ